MKRNLLVAAVAVIFILGAAAVFFAFSSGENGTDWCRDIPGVQDGAEWATVANSDGECRGDGAPTTTTQAPAGLCPPAGCPLESRVGAAESAVADHEVRIGDLEEWFIGKGCSVEEAEEVAEIVEDLAGEDAEGLLRVMDPGDWVDIAARVCGIEIDFSVGAGSPAPEVIVVPGPGPTPTTEGFVPKCRDGLDNDGDGLIDFRADPGCSSRNDNSENSDRPVTTTTTPTTTPPTTTTTTTTTTSTPPPVTAVEPTP